MKYITVLITDTHFGTHNNSMTWLRSQKEFFDKQVIPHLKELKNSEYSIRLIHCGDVFDSRSTINSYVATQVVKLFDQMCDVVDKLLIVNGNHDFYQPSDDSVDTVTLIFKQLQLIHKDKLDIISDKKVLGGWGNEVSLYVPWYEWIKHDDLIEYLENYKEGHDKPITHLFTHADIVRDKYELDIPNIISGHIHTPMFVDNLKNLGSVFALTFADCNSARGFYEYEDGGELKFIENKYSIRFWRFYDDDIFKISDDLQKDDYIEIYLSKANISKKKYVDRWSELAKEYKNIWRYPKIEDDDGSGRINAKQFEGYNIETMTESLIPDELKDKFEKVKQYINTNKD